MMGPISRIGRSQFFRPPFTVVNFGTITLNWPQDGNGTPTYTILRSTSLGGTYSSIGTTTSGTYTDSGLTAGTTYYYQINWSEGTNTSRLTNTLAMASAIVGASSTTSLLNVQIVDGGAEKTGEEQVGYSGSDYWNEIGTPLYSGDEPADGAPFFGASNMVDSAGNATAVGVFAYDSNDDNIMAEGSGSSSSDHLFQSWAFTSGGSDWNLEIDNLTAGTYDFYMYASLADFPIGSSVVFDITSGSSGSASVNAGGNYCVLSSISVSSDTPIVITISSDYEPVCNGLQIVRIGD